MKNSLKLTALALFLSTGIFAAVPAKSTSPASAAPTKDIVTFTSLASLRGLEIKVEKNSPGKSMVLIYDQDGNVIFKDALQGQKAKEKGYVLDQLEDGDYTIEVVSDKQSVKKEIHVYDDNNTRTFFMLQQ